MLNEKEVDQKVAHRSATADRCMQGISAAGQLCLQQLYVFGFSKIRVLPREASQAKGSQKRFELEQELGHILTA